MEAVSLIRVSVKTQCHRPSDKEKKTCNKRVPKIKRKER